jgi:pimeloyl-ACP methyl ester carboxylesterase
MTPRAAEASPRRSHRVDTGTAIIECVEQGRGDAVVLLPAGGCTCHYLDGLASALVAARFRTISVNLRGAGASVGPLDHVTLHTLAADVAAVLEHLGAAPAHIVGHAFGNRVARCLASDRPGSVRRLVLLAAGGQIAPNAATQEAARQLVRTDLADADWFAALRAVYLSPHSDPALVRQLEQTPAATRVHATAGRATPAEDWQDGGDAPMLILQGLDDRMAPPANGHALRERLGERVRVIDLPRAGHLLPLEAVAAVTDAVIDFLRRPAPV